MERPGREQTPQHTDTLVWGKNPVTELLKSGETVDTVYLADSLPQAVAGYYTALAKQSGAVVKRVPGNKLQKLCATADHQGVAARAAEVVGIRPIKDKIDFCIIAQCRATGEPRALHIHRGEVGCEVGICTTPLRGIGTKERAKGVVVGGSIV